MPRWGKVGKQKIVDEGPLAPFPNMKDMQNWQEGRKAKYDMETFDDVLVKHTNDFMDKAKSDGKPFFIWHNTTRMHVFTYIPPKYQAMMNATNNYNIEEAGMAQMDDSVGEILKHLDDIGEADNTIVIFTTDNGAEVFTWPDGGMTPFKATKGTTFEGGFRVPCIARWPGHIQPSRVENGIFSGLDWLPTLSAAAGNPDITDQLLKGVTIGDRQYKNHLDGYNQIDLINGKGPSKRHEIFYFGGPHLGALRIDDFKYQFYPAAVRMAWREGHDRYAHHREPSARSVRAYIAISWRKPEQHGRGIHERLHGARVLALRDGPEVRREARDDGDRLSRRCRRRRTFNLQAVKAQSRGNDETARRPIV